MSDIRFQIKNGFNAKNGALTVNTSTGRIGANTHTPAVSFDINTSDAIKLPVGNTTTRPTGAAGYLRYNSETSMFEGYTASGWGPISGAFGGSNTQVIVNDQGNSTGFTTLTFNKLTGTLTVNGTTINATSFALGTGTFQANSTAFSIGNTIANTTSVKVGNTVVISGQVALSSTATINATFYTGQSNTALTANVANTATFATSAGSALTANTANTATTATTATNASTLQGWARSDVIHRPNHTGNLPSNVMSGTDQTAARFFGTTYLYSYGDIYAQGNIYAYYSDRRLKKDFNMICNALESVQSLTGYHYKQNELGASLGFKDDRPQVGLIAQEVQAVLPEAVSIAAFDRNEDGTSKSGENYLTISYEKLIPLLVNAIKELSTKVDMLEKRNA